MADRQKLQHEERADYSGNQREHLPVVKAGRELLGKLYYPSARRKGIPVECFCDNSIKVASLTFVA